MRLVLSLKCCFLVGFISYHFISRQWEAAKSKSDPALSQGQQVILPGLSCHLDWKQWRERHTSQRPMRSNCVDGTFCFQKSGVFLSRKSDKFNSKYFRAERFCLSFLARFLFSLSLPFGITLHTEHCPLMLYATLCHHSSPREFIW